MKTFIIIWMCVFVVEAAFSAYQLLMYNGKPSDRTRGSAAIGVAVAVVFVLTGSMAIMLDS